MTAMVIFEEIDDLRLTRLKHGSFFVTLPMLGMYSIWLVVLPRPSLFLLGGL